MRAVARCAAPASGSTTASSATARRSPRARPAMLAPTRELCARPAYRSGWWRRSRRPSRRRPRLDERACLRDEAAVLRRAVQAYLERIRADEGAQQQPVTRVVDEAEVDIRIVHRGVAAERIVADVERVIGARGDLQPSLVSRIEDRRRNLADTPAEAGLQLSVDDHLSLAKALRRRAGTGCL